MLCTAVIRMKGVEGSATLNGKSGKNEIVEKAIKMENHRDINFPVYPLRLPPPRLICLNSPICLEEFPMTSCHMQPPTAKEVEHYKIFWKTLFCRGQYQQVIRLTKSHLIQCNKLCPANIIYAQTVSHAHQICRQSIHKWRGKINTNLYRI